MIRRTKDEMNKTLEALIRMKEIQEKKYHQISAHEKSVLKVRQDPSGKQYYSVQRKGAKKFSYLGNSSVKEVNDIKEAKYLKKSLSRIEANIQLLKFAAEKLESVDYDAVNMSLPAVYRDPSLSYAFAGTVNRKAARWKQMMESRKAEYEVFRPEELKVRTDDGMYVRSKSEAMIYNTLLSMGITFVYEMPLVINGKLYRPDFVVLSEIDYEILIIIEHQGMMNDEQYRNRFCEKLCQYYIAGYIQGINIFFTFDSSDGGFDKTPVEDIIRTRIKQCRLQ